MKSLPTLIIVLLGVTIGVTLPDADRLLGLAHRSGLTHAAWLPIGLAFAPRWRIAGGALGCGIGVHLIADLFPRAMRGYATIKLPLLGSLGLWSYPWIALHAAIALWLGLWLLRPVLGGTLAGLATLVIAIGIALVYLGNDRAALPALLAATAIGWAIRRLAASRIR